MVLTLLCLAGPAQALKFVYPEKPDHTLWVHVETDPPGADIYAPAQEEDDEPTWLGKTPAVLVAELSWGKKYFQTYWRTMRIWSPGEACQSVYNIDKSYDLYLNLLVSRADFATQQVHAVIASLPPPGFFWDGRKDWPEHSTLKIRLNPSAPEDQKLPSSALALPPSTVVLGRDSGDLRSDPGVVVIVSNVEESDVIVDNEFAGRTPLRMVLQQGRHIIEVRKTGYQPFIRQVQVSSGTVSELKTTLAPEAAEADSE